jgi:quercetin dioxygenase-like cupin family protein
VVCDTGVSRDWPATYVGEVFGFVLEGQLTVSVGNETYVLSPGDSIHYQALQPHCWRNDGDEPCTALWAASPPVLEADLREEEPEGRR